MKHAEQTIHNPNKTALTLLVISVLLIGAAAPAQVDSISLDDFETPDESWTYVGGQEFPGAKGALQWDASNARSGNKSLKLHADFTGGGAYVGLWKVLPGPKDRDITDIRFWVKTQGVRALGLRILDDSGQCHQKKNVPLKNTDQWQQLILPIRELIGDEHWGGANDGKWHGPAAAFGINIGADGLDGKSGTLWLDDAACSLAPAVPASAPTVLPCRLSPPSARPGFGTSITYRWQAIPMHRDYSVFVHIRDADGRIVLQDDHTPPQGTAIWSGPVEYERSIVLSPNMPHGRYDIVVGLYDSKHGQGRRPLKPGPGLTAADDPPTACKVGALTVSPEAPIPQLPPPTLNLDGWRLTFNEDFTEPLSVSAWGPGTRWIAHTPYAGDFGDARFADPQPGFPFTIQDGILRIEAKKDNNRWRSGLLCSVDKNGDGFAQKYGYFEMRAKLPKGPGTWPAFWLLGLPRLHDKSVDQIEIDVLEQYGRNPNALHTNIHIWYGDGRHTGDEQKHFVTGMTDDFHNYGVMVDEQNITFYYDGRIIRRETTPEEAKVPLYVLANLALGAGWPIDKTPNPSYMYIDYIRAYAK